MSKIFRRSLSLLLPQSARLLFKYFCPDTGFYIRTQSLLLRLSNSDCVMGFRVSAAWLRSCLFSRFRLHQSSVLCTGVLACIIPWLILSDSCPLPWSSLHSPSLTELSHSFQSCREIHLHLQLSKPWTSPCLLTVTIPLRFGGHVIVLAVGT